MASLPLAGSNGNHPASPRQGASGGQCGIGFRLRRSRKSGTRQPDFGRPSPSYQCALPDPGQPGRVYFGSPRIMGTTHLPEVKLIASARSHHLKCRLAPSTVPGTQRYDAASAVFVKACARQRKQGIAVVLFRQRAQNLDSVVRDKGHLWAKFHPNSRHI